MVSISSPSRASQHSSSSSRSFNRRKSVPVHHGSTSRHSPQPSSARYEQPVAPAASLVTTNLPIMNSSACAIASITTSQPWLEKLQANSRSVPFHECRNLHPLPKHHLPPVSKASLMTTGATVYTQGQASSLRSISRPQSSTQSDILYPYQLALSSIENLPLPQGVVQLTLASRPLTCELQVRATLFDTELGRFFGKTWISPVPTHVHLNKDRHAQSSSRLGLANLKKRKADLGLKSQAESEITHDIDLESSQDDTSSNSDEIYLATHRVTVKLSEICLYFHTPVKSPHVVVVIEFVFLVKNALSTQEQAGSSDTPSNENPISISAGWTIIYPFNVAKKRHKYFKSMASEPLPIFSGSPRILLSIFNQLYTATSGYPGLLPLLGASFAYRFLTRPDLRSVGKFWKENVFVAPGNHIPGIKRISLRGISAYPLETGRISRISISVYPSLDKYESKLLDRISKIQFDNHPTSLTPDDDGNLPSPTIIERRLHVGFHNTCTFIGQPTVITLKPTTSDYKIKQLGFMGTVELDTYVPDDPMVAVVFIMEYKVSLTVNVPEIKKRTGLSRIISKLASSDANMAEPAQLTEDIDKFAVAGWCAYSPYQDTLYGDHDIYLETQNTLNPSGALIFTSKNVDYNEESEFREELVSEDEKGHRAWPLKLSFKFNTPMDNPKPLAVSLPKIPIDDVLCATPSEPIKVPDEPLLKSECVIIPTVDPDIEKDTLSNLESATTKLSAPQPQEESPNTDNDEELVAIDTFNPLLYDAHTLSPLSKKSSSDSPFSRIERARLHNFGFEMILDDDHQPPTEIKTSGIGVHHIITNLQIEEKDPLYNDITILFQGLSFSQDAFHHLNGRFPKSVYFSFQFFTFPYTTLEKLHVYTGPLPAKKNFHGSINGESQSHRVPHNSSREAQGGGQRSQAPHASNPSFGNSVFDSSNSCMQEHIWPGILYRYDQDGSPIFDHPPGATANFKVDTRHEPFSLGSRMGPNAIANYLSKASLFIDVWDGDTLLHLGSGCAKLNLALRQGRPSIYYEDNVDIIWNDFADENKTAVSQRTSPSNVGLTTTQLGNPSGHTNGTSSIKTATLHIRITNIGRKNALCSDENHLKSDTILDNRKSYETILVHDYHHHIKHRQKTFHEAKRLQDVDHELNQILTHARDERAARCQGTTSTHCSVNSVGKTEYSPTALSRSQRLVQHTADILRGLTIGPSQLLQSTEEAITNNLPLGSYKLSREERDCDLDTIDTFRERRRKEATQEMLRREITTFHSIDVAFSQAIYFEFEFTNPYSTSHTFRLSWLDQELRVVVDTQEWRFHRKVHGMAMRVDGNLVRMGQDGVTAELFLEGDETVSIPFIFQSFLGGPTSPVEGTTTTEDKDVQRIGGSESLHSPGIDARSINILVLNSCDQPAAILALSVHPRPYSVDRVIRLFRGEDDMIRKVLRFPLSKTPLVGRNGSAAIFDSAHPTQVYVRSNTSDAICTLGNTSSDSATKEVIFKYRVGPAPETKIVYILFYTDPFHTLLHEVWRVFVHSLYRFDMNAVLCQTSSASLVLRGTGMSRSVMCYSSLPQEITIDTRGPFMLNANALNEVILLARPQDTRTKESIMNVVDANSGFLVSSWLIVSHCDLPEVTKTFELTLPRDKQTSKRVSYTSPFFQRKCLYLRTDSPHLIQFKEPVLDLEPGGSQFICMKFLPGHMLARADILVFLNDEVDTMEECLALKIRYVQSS
ncbi:hypothetical protein BASA50_003257 [Batrachochytrium salamandrivorans]|uniref:Nephrocystin-4 n=1 Tax=Batrachochytrium salamandrivorans TaxID=1357716 RepID=A0ABQ8FJ59_9FUNG|nr:hypothetical protein BASA50_003257 [Batrachochytrium salamandrivorans]